LFPSLPPIEAFKEFYWISRPAYSVRTFMFCSGEGAF